MVNFNSLLRPSIALSRRRILPRTISTSVNRRVSPSAAHIPAPSDSHLRQSFDQSHSIASKGSKPSGLFLQPSLSHPSAFVPLAQRTILRASFIVDRICLPLPTIESIEQAEILFLAMVKNLDRLSDLLCGVIDLAEVVRNVHPEEVWREEANNAYEELVGFMNELNTHVGLYESLKSIHTLLPPITSSTSPALFAAHSVALPFLRDFEKSGIHLPDASREKFVQLSSEIITLGREFLQNAMQEDGRAGVKVTRDQAAELGEGFARRLFPNGSRSAGNQETTIDPTSWEARVMARQHPSSDFRAQLFKAANSSPSSHVETLNSLFRTRASLAQLVGRGSWAEVALEDKMARTPGMVMGFLENLNKHNLPIAQRDLVRLQQARKEVDGTTQVNAWDRDFLTDVIGHSMSPLPDISPFFSLGTCFIGLSRLFSSLYGVRFEVDPLEPGESWNGVQKLRVVDEEEGRIGTIYCDLFMREGKQAGAAHYTVRCSRRLDDDDAENDFVDGKALAEGVEVDRKDLEGLEVKPVKYKGRKGLYQDPVIALVCAFGRRGEGNGKEETAFLQWHEVETLFHEMGHAIHSLIGRTDYHNVAGTRCATDFVELPSILMEHFLASPSVVSMFSSHHTTGRPLPPDVLTALLEERKQFSALETSTQITMAAVDQLYHSPLALSSSSGFDTSKILSKATSDFHVIPYVPGTSPQTQFTHFFGYGATYYSYLFDKAIAARVFETQFAENPLSREKGDKFKKDLLKWGGGKEPWEMVGIVVGSDVVREGGEKAMREVGRWGIEECKRGN
ncbi:mitochondrial intermediate peptidase [Meredithblackwellia eburnea MCA 4105]